MMRSIRIILVILVMGFIQYSCTERINIDLDESYARLVVDGSVTTETKSHSVILSKTSSYYFNQPPLMVSGAIVSISDGIKSITLTESEPGIYCTPSFISGVEGKTYTLTIRLDSPIGGFADFSAKSVLESSPEIDSLKLVFHPGWSMNGLWEVLSFLQEPEGDDYYRFLLSKNNRMITDTLYEWFVTDDRFLIGGYGNGATIGFLDQGIPDQALSTGDTVIAEINGITKEYSDFITQAQEELRGSNPLFSGPRANVKGNISNGAIGFFSAYSVNRASVIVMPE